MCNVIQTGVWFHGFVAIPMWNILDSLELITLIEGNIAPELSKDCIWLGMVSIVRSQNIITSNMYKKYI